ncbi:MAG: hypothetical protein RLN63_08090 [Miltoncostaeaceae bacterium]
MNNVSAPPTRPRRRRAPAIFAASVAAAGVAAFAPGANGATVVQPPNQGFDTDASNWTATDSCTLLDGLVGGLVVSDTGEATPITPALLQDLLDGLLGGTGSDPALGGLLSGLLGSGSGTITPGGEGLLQELVNALTGGGANSEDLLTGDGLLDLSDLIGTLNGLTNGSVSNIVALLESLGITCNTTAGFTGADGNPAGALEFSVSGLLPSAVNALQLLGKGEATFRSSDFTYIGGTPTAVAFNFDAKADLENLLEIGSGLRLVGTLERIDQPGSLTLGSYDFTGSIPFQTRGLELPADALVPGASYRIILQVETLGTLNLLASTQRLLLDNIRLAATTPNGSGGPGGSGTGDGAGGLGACTTNIVEPAPARQNSSRGTIALSREQLLINQRISQAGVRRVNSLLDKFEGGLTSRDFQDCTIGSQKFAPALTAAIAVGAAAGPASPTEVQGPRPVRERVPGTGNPEDVALSRAQLIINQRISQAAVRRVNAITDRMNGRISAGDFRRGSLEAVTLNSDGRSMFANALPNAGVLSSTFVPFDIARRPGEGSGQFTLSRQQLLINQRISQAAVRRINAIRAQLAVGLTGENVRNGGLSRSTLAPSIQLGQR